MLNRKNITLWSLTLIFIVPFITAWLAYSKGLFLSGRTTNHGTMITPPFKISALELQNDHKPLGVGDFRGKWWLIYLTDNLTDSTTLRYVYYIRQIRQATGKNRDRVAQGVITIHPTSTQQSWLTTHYPNTVLFTISPEKIADLEQVTKKLALAKGSIYLVDPLGNVIMLYTKDAAPKGILKDLERVLKVSQIG